MSIQIIIPHVGETTTTVRISRWLKTEGQRVRKGEPVLEIDTDKNTLEIEALADGILAKIVVAEGSDAEAMQVVGLIEIQDQVVTPGRHEVLIERKGSGHATPIAAKVASELGIDVEIVKGTGPDGRVTQNDVRDYAAKRDAARDKPLKVNASPKAKRIAAELGVDLAEASRAGSGELIRAADVLARQSAPAISPEMPTHTAFSRQRRAIAARMTQSKTTIPHFYLQVEVDMSLCGLLRNHCHDNLGWPQKPTFNDLVVRAAALSLRAMPGVNVCYRDDGFDRRQSIGIGIAVSLDDGLVVPVLRDADRLDLARTHEQIQGLAARARSGKFREGDLGEKSIVVTNLGMYGMDAFIAIIDPPDSMILAVGRVRDAIVPINGQAALRSVCTFTLSADHRVLDGAAAAKYLARVKMHLENPFELIQ